jgi:hypothetical protein
MSTSELDVRASIWNLLSARRDIDSLTLEFLGKYHVESIRCEIPENADRPAFNLVCQLEMIFDLQRTHLQSWTPYGDFDIPDRAESAQVRVNERLPYLLSLPTAEGAFACLCKLATDYIERFQNDRSVDISLRRMTFVRALISGARMLCLHPSVGAGDTLPQSRLTRQNFGFREQVMTQVCDSALEKVPEKHQALYLHRMSRHMVYQFIHSVFIVISG